MKLLFKCSTFTSLVALSVLSLANADEGLQRVNLRGGGAGTQPDLDAIAPVQGDVVLEKFKKQHVLLEGVEVPRQRVSPNGSFKANGRKYDLTDLQPMNVFSRGATYMEDGIVQSLEDESRRSRLYMKKGEDGETIIVTMVGGTVPDENDEVESIEVFGHDGSGAYMEAMEDGTLGTIRKEDRDFSQLQRFNFGGFDNGGDSLLVKRSSPKRQSRSFDDDDKFDDDDDGNFDGEDDADDEYDDDTFSQNLIVEELGGDRRHLQEGACSSYKVIEVAIAYDSTFCSQVAGGSASQARSIVEQTVVRASQAFEGMCVRVKVSHLEGYCSSSGDPYRQTMIYDTIGCSDSRGILQEFRDFWNNNRQNVSRDSAHLFYGKELVNDNAIGCAYVGTLCDQWSYGVNEMSYFSDLQMRGVLFAHELGHNAGANHYTGSGQNYVMGGGDGSNGFSSQSTTSVEAYLNTASCVATEGGGSGDGGGGGDSSSFRVESARRRGKCMTVVGPAENGTPVELRSCRDSSAGQNWVWDSQTHLLKSSKGNNKCLLPSGNAGNRAVLQLWDCDPSYTYAEWSYYSDKTFRPDYNTDRCLGVKSDGTTLALRACDGNRSRKWLIRQ